MTTRKQKQKRHNNMEFAGWCGVGIIVVAYTLVSFNIITSNSLLYQILNLLGAMGIIAISHAKGLVQLVVLNIFWAIIASIALIRMLV